MKQVILFIALCLMAPLLKGQDTIAKKQTTAKKADTIIKRNGEVLVVLLTEINQTEICYKRYDYQDGPVFKLPKQDIKYIGYGNGTQESFESYVAPYTPPSAPVALNAPDLAIYPAGWKYYYKSLLIPEGDMIRIAEKQHDKKIDLMINKVEKKKAWQYIVLIGGGLLVLDGLYLLAANRVSSHHRGASAPSSMSQQQSRNLGRLLVLGGIGCGAVSLYFRFDRRRTAHLVMDLYNQTVVH